MNTYRLAWIPGLVVALAASTAHAQDADASGSFSLTSDGATASSSSSGSGDGGYMERYRPEAGLLELGVFGGVLLPSKKHNLHDEALIHREYGTAAPEFGLRVGYFPLSFAGAEVEGGIGFDSVAGGGNATLGTVRGHLVGQLPFWSVTPFVVGGYGRYFATSDDNGDDGDPDYYFGAGVKVPVNDFLSIRLDVRDNLMQKNDAEQDVLTHHPEILLGLSGTIGRSERAAPPPPDADGDGFLDSADSCPNEPGVAPDGCPLRDSDGDGIMDKDDQCPDKPGPAPTGCPVLDGDGDGFNDDVDKCPTVAGIAPDGCPDADPDKDGIVGDADKCPQQPETVNAYEDQDGCPDEVPDKVKRFTGVIAGIEFDTGKATIRATSRPTLDQAAAVLVEYPALRVAISGHTDNAGTHDMNMKLSADRAESVKAYLVSKGVDAGRIETRGAGPDEPIADNKTADGRQKNRRIEFKLIAK